MGLVVVSISLLGVGGIAAQVVHEVGVQATWTRAVPEGWVAGFYGAIRIPDRLRIAGQLGLGGVGGATVVRGELLSHFLLSPGRRGRPGFYAGGGLALVTGKNTAGFGVLLAGLEQSPRGGGGWSIEAGFGGGFRVTMGYRWRWFPRTSPTEL